MSFHPSAWCSGTKGWIEHSCGHDTGASSDTELSFIVHEPSGIIEWFSAMSLRSRPER